MSQLFEVKEIDRKFYAERVLDFLPERIIDIHTHVWLERFRSAAMTAPRRTVTWPSRVASSNSIEDHLESYRLLFPGKHVLPMIFGNAVDPVDDIEAGNAYIRRCAAEYSLPALLFATPRWSSAELEERVLAGGFLGVKVYLSLAEPYIPAAEIRIFDFLPPHQLEVLDRHGWIVMLHLPRPKRLRDPVNLAQMLQIEERYPNVKVIIAHVGRAYCPEDVGNAFEVLRRTRRMRFDISANTNAWVFERLIEAVGPKRILFGSDLPIVRMRMRRICESGTYINLVPRGLYGDVSGDPNMREVDGEEAERLSFFMYEEIDAFRSAAEVTGLTREEVGDIFWGNGARLLREVGFEVA
ncbi:MAG TPA: amidohydrolase family protein [Armatimonadota bacterium]|nr:amidohydrolase [Armatimonadota bacterium]HPT99939.1 amidohydrolase family protein [Armatimonadota bacterium]